MPLNRPRLCVRRFQCVLSVMARVLRTFCFSNGGSNNRGYVTPCYFSFEVDNPQFLIVRRYPVPGARQTIAKYYRNQKSKKKNEIKCFPWNVEARNLNHNIFIFAHINIAFFVLKCEMANFVQFLYKQMESPNGIAITLHCLESLGDPTLLTRTHSADVQWNGFYYYYRYDSSLCRANSHPRIIIKTEMKSFNMQ